MVTLISENKTKQQRKCLTQPTVAHNMINLRTNYSYNRIAEGNKLQPDLSTSPTNSEKKGPTKLENRERSAPTTKTGTKNPVKKSKSLNPNLTETCSSNFENPKTEPFTKTLFVKRKNLGFFNDFFAGDS